MAITIEELSGILTRGEIKHAFDKDGDIYFGFQTENYTNPAGDKSLGMYVRISNEGQMFTLTAHEAFLVKGSKHINAFLKLCSILQMSGYLIQFEYARRDNALPPEGPNAAKDWVNAISDHILEDHRRFTTELLGIFLDTDEIKNMDVFSRAYLPQRNFSIGSLPC